MFPKKEKMNNNNSLNIIKGEDGLSVLSKNGQVNFCKETEEIEEIREEDNDIKQFDFVQIRKIEKDFKENHKGYLKIRGEEKSYAEEERNRDGLTLEQMKTYAYDELINSLDDDY